MGCDIHLAVQARDASGNWETVSPPTNWNKDKLEESEDGESYDRGSWFTDRNYHLFTALADVRNDGLMLPLFPVRGLPDGVPNEDWEFGDHSFSWLTLAEVDASPIRSMTTPYTGVVEVGQYDKWKKSGETYPDGWCKSISGPGIVICDEDQLFMSRGDGPFQLKPKATHVSARWAVKGEEAFLRFLKFTDYLRRYGSPEDIRLVFGFDN